MRTRFSSALGLVVLAVFLIPATATADLGEVLGEIEWGDSREEVLEKLREERLAELREDHSLRSNPARMQDARQRVLDQMRGVEDSYTELEGSSTGFEVSVVAEEFTPDNNESLLRIRDDVAQRFYMFLDGELYKLVVAYDQDYIEGVGFEAFVRQVSSQYGDPVSSEQGDDGLEQAVWHSPEFELRVDDRRQYFGTFTMTFADRQLLEQLRADDRQFGGSNREDPGQRRNGVSSRVSEVTTPSSESQNDNIVDQMVGEDVEVDLGSEEEEEEEGEETASRDDEEEEEEEEETATASAESSSEDSSSSEPEESSSEEASSSSGGGGDDDGDDDLVIY